MNSKEKKDYLKYRKAYLKVGNLLSENQILFSKALQNQEEIKEIITKGWGY